MMLKASEGLSGVKDLVHMYRAIVHAGTLLLLALPLKLTNIASSGWNGIKTGKEYLCEEWAKRL
jgi:hypothetical protein